MTHEEILGTVTANDKLIALRTAVDKAAFLIESVLMLQGASLTPAAAKALFEAHVQLISANR